MVGVCRNAFLSDFPWNVCRPADARQQVSECSSVIWWSVVRQNAQMFAGQAAPLAKHLRARPGWHARHSCRHTFIR